MACATNLQIYTPHRLNRAPPVVHFVLVRPLQHVTTTESITFGIALLGAALGILNTWRSFDRDRIKLRVTPKFYMPVGSKNIVSSATLPSSKSSLYERNPNLHEQISELCIEVINLSTFPVTISEVGFRCRGTHDKFLLHDYFVLDGGSKLPRRLEPHTSVTLYAPRSEAGKTIYPDLRCAYALSDSGVSFKGTSQALKTIAKRYACKRNVV